MVQTLRIKTTKSDHDYKVLTAGGHVQRHSLIAHGVPLVINNYIEKLTFHVMRLRTVDVVLGYIWFYNRHSLYIDWPNHTISFEGNNNQQVFIHGIAINNLMSVNHLMLMIETLMHNFMHVY